MKNLFPSCQSKEKTYISEMMETEIADGHKIHPLPRHLSAPETKSHRGGHNLSKIDYAPRVCRIDAREQNQANIALDILKYQLSDRASRQKHLENVRHNLNRRLQVAKSQGNNQLLNILQDEYQQLETSV